MLRNLFKRKQTLNKDQIAELLKVHPEALEYFEHLYESTSLNNIDDNFFNINSKQTASMRKENKIDVDYDADELLSITDKIVDELLIVAGLKEADEDFKFMTKEELNAVPLSVRPQLSGSLIQRDIGEYSYIALLSQYVKWKETEDIRFYHSFRQGLDILDLDPITYEIIGMNPNSMGFWLPEVEKAVEITNFFKSPKTKVVKVPLPILQLTRLEYSQHTPATIKIVNDFCMKAFNLDVNKKYFVKTGTYSSKFDFRNALVQGEQEVRELGEYLLFIHSQALQMASPLAQPTIYGVSTTNEWVVREFIEDVESNPKIYKGMPLHTEYRVFVDFDSQEILGMSPYWREDVMKKSFSSGEIDNHKKHDYIVYKLHEDTLYGRYYENEDRILKEVKELISHMNLPGQWSIDIMQNGDDFYVIDMALATQSALNDCVDSAKLKKIEEKWIPQLKG